MGGFWQISADSSGKREHWDGVWFGIYSAGRGLGAAWFGIARGAGWELVPTPGPRLYELGPPGVAHPAGACGRRESRQQLDSRV